MAEPGQLPTAAQQSGPATVPIELPAPTAWPIVFAFGLSLTFAGMVTSESISILGAILSVVAAVGWFREVLPHEACEVLRVSERALPVVTAHAKVERIGGITRQPDRSRLPLEIYPVSAGVKGGLAGSVAMALLAMVYGIASHHSIWYPINLVAAGFFPGIVNQTTAQLEGFHLDVFLIACAIHLTTSVVVGLLYGATLPMIPRHPVLLGGVMAPIVWTGLLYTIMGIINPVLDQRISWLWFAISQVGFGIVAGVVVSQQERVRTWQNTPLVLRAGIEAPGMGDER